MTTSANSAGPTLIGPAMTQSRFALTPAAVLVGIGYSCVVLGGLMAAVTGPLALAKGSWLAAYLVLVGGVAQYAMGRARTWNQHGNRSASWGWVQIAAWNLGNVAVMGGTLFGQTLLVDLGSALLVVALVVALRSDRNLSGRSHRSAAGPVFGWAYRILLAVLAVSIPVGMVLSHLQHS